MKKFYLIILFLFLGCPIPTQVGIEIPPIEEEIIEEEIPEEVILKQKIVISENKFNLEWDFIKPLPGNYIVYYRPLNSVSWIFLKDNIELSFLEINSDLLDYGDYEFAVSFMPMNGVETELHTSLDNTAIPSSGWYVSWMLQ